MPARTMAPGPWLPVGSTLFVAGSLLLLVGSAWALAVTLPNATAWSSVPGLVLGGVSLAAALRLRSPPERAAAAGGLGVLALVLDFAGLSGPPRVIPGALLLAGAAIAAGSTRPADGRSPPLTLAMASIGAVAHAVVGLAMVPLGLVAPAWAIILLLIVWAALVALAVRQRRTRPQLFLAAPVVSAALTAGLLDVGGRFLHWMP